MIKRGEGIKIVNFMTHVGLVLGRAHISHIVIVHYFFKNLLFSLSSGMIQTNKVHSDVKPWKGLQKL